MSEQELKEWIQAGFAGLREEMNDFRSEVRAEMQRHYSLLKADINLAHAQYENIINLLQTINEGESPALIERMTRVEGRVAALEKRRR
ncbi:MAG: hypothetical protein ACTHQM_15300 [Thermoanaerobaculia bacterium]